MSDEVSVDDERAAFKRAFNSKSKNSNESSSKKGDGVAHGALNIVKNLTGGSNEEIREKKRRMSA